MFLVDMEFECERFSKSDTVGACLRTGLVFANTVTRRNSRDQDEAKRFHIVCTEQFNWQESFPCHRIMAA
jgi:hypothetical protein